MDKEENYASESDLSDEDFCPENEAGTDLSEESSDDEIEDEEQTTENTKKQNKRQRKSKKKTQKSKTIKTDEENQSKRNTRQKTETNVDTTTKKLEKDELESDDEEKKRADALWADFLGDVKQTTNDVEENKKETKSAIIEKLPTRKTNKTSTVTATSTNGDTLNGKELATEEKPKQITITEIMDFAGEEVKIQKVVNAESIKENKTKSVDSVVNNPTTTAMKRSAAPSSSKGLGSILNQIGKKKKISVLEKTKLDWNNFKQDEGIDEEIQTFNKGKDGYLERQDFLQRTDLRQFEIERNLRQTRRNH